MDNDRATQIADAIWALGDKLDTVSNNLDQIATALYRLGSNDADTCMGGLELIGKEVRDGCQEIAAVIADKQ